MDELEGQDQSTGLDQGSPNEGTVNINPAWNEALDHIPSEAHSLVTPVFSKWDKNVQQQIQQVHSQYEPYKPFVDAGYDADTIQYGLGLLNAIQTDPKGVLEALQQHLLGEEGQPEQQGQQNQPQPEFDVTQHPEFQKINQVVQSMAQIILSEREQAQQAQADQELDQELNAAKEKHGDFDEQYVLALMLHREISLEDAIAEYQSLANNILTQQRKPGPVVLGSSGAFPNTNRDVSELDDKARRQLVLDMLGGGS